MSIVSPFEAPAARPLRREVIGAELHTVTVDGVPVIRGTLPHGPVSVSLEFITPATALRWLEEWNTRNRTKQAARVAGHVRDMQADNWLFIGDVVRFAFDEKGQEYLADGQHRLDAITKSGIGQWYIVVRGLADDAQEVIDTGKARSLTDTLGMQGWADPGLASSIARRLAMWDQGQVQGVWTGGQGATRQLTKSEVHKYADAHRAEIEAAVKVAKSMRTAGFSVPPAVVAAAYAVLARVDQHGADIFVVDNLVKGVGVDSENHPARRLRNRLTRSDRWGIKDTGEAFMMTLKAWNHWREDGNDSVERLQRPRDGWGMPAEFRIR